MAYSRIGISLCCVVLLRCMLYEANSTTLALGEWGRMFRNIRDVSKHAPATKVRPGMEGGEGGGAGFGHVDGESLPPPPPPPPSSPRTSTTYT